MPIDIPVSRSSFGTNTTTLGGTEYDFRYEYNDRTKLWTLVILSNDVVVKAGITVMETQDLLGQYLLPDFDHGTVMCLRLQNDNKRVGRNNLGIGKAYRLVYYTNQEIANIGG